MRRTKEEAEVTRQRLLDAALKLFSRQGYASTTLDDVARQAEVTRGAVYWHFPSGKPELYRSLVRERFAAATTIVNEVLASDLSPLAKLRRLMIRSLEYLEEDAAYRAVLELTLFRPETSPELQGGLDDKASATRGYLEQLAALVRAGIASGEVRADAEPEALALGALGLVNGVATMWLVDRDAFSPRAQAAAIVEGFMRGVAAR